MKSLLNPEIRTCKESELAILQSSIPSGSHKKRFDKQLAGNAEYLIAWVNDELVGFFLMDYQGQQYLPGIPEIRDGEVAGEYRSHGIGTALIHECEKRAKLHGSDKVTMLVAHDNPRALQLIEVVEQIYAGSPSNQGLKLDIGNQYPYDGRIGIEGKLDHGTYQVHVHVADTKDVTKYNYSSTVAY